MTEANEFDLSQSLNRGVVLLSQLDLRKRRRCLSNRVIRSLAIETGKLAPGVEYWICESPASLNAKRMQLDEREGRLPPGFCESVPFCISMIGSLNGYVAFPKRRAPLLARSAIDRSGLLDFIPVHGGVTWALKDEFACVYGFDTQHFDSERVPRDDKLWIRWQCKILYQSILRTAKVERAFRRSRNPEDRIRIAQSIVDIIPEENMGMGALLRLISGEI